MKRLMAALLGLLVLTVPLTSRAASSLDRVGSATDWINGSAPAPSLRGRVVIVDVFTVDCINCRNVVPLLRLLYAANRSRGLTIVGIHSPETPWEKRGPYVAENVKSQGIAWPVAIDNSFELWRAYGIQAWPTQLIFDRRGRLRKTVVGDSQDSLVAATVEGLLNER